MNHVSALYNSFFKNLKIERKICTGGGGAKIYIPTKFCAKIGEKPLANNYTSAHAANALSRIEV